LDVAERRLDAVGHRRPARGGRQLRRDGVELPAGPLGTTGVDTHHALIHDYFTQAK
jgi:hypothetical protein